MARVRVSTTVDDDLLQQVRKMHPGSTDAEMIDDALKALRTLYRAGEIDAAYATAYEQQPIDQPDEWGDLASFRDASASS